MAEPVFRSDGSPIAEKDIPTAIASGEAHFDGSREYDVNVKGTRYKVRGDQVWGALQQGGRLEGSAEARAREVGESGEEAVTAFFEGAGSSASFGGTDVIARAIGGKPYAERAEMRQEVHESPYAAGELAGFIPGLIGTGGGTGALGAAGKVARVVGAPGRAVSRAASAGGRTVAEVLGGGRAAQVAGAATTGAIEGVAFQAGREVSAAAIRDKEISPEAILAAGGMGAGIGAGLGSIAQVLGAVPGNEKVLRSLARKSAVSALHPSLPNLKKLGRTHGSIEKGVDNVGEELLKSGMLGKLGTRGPEDVAPLVAAEVKKVGAELGKLRNQIDDVVETWTKGAKSQGITPPVDLRAHVQKFFKTVDDDILHPLQQSDSPTTRRAAINVERRLENIRKDFTDGQHISLKRLEKFRRDLRDELPEIKLGVRDPLLMKKLEGVEGTLRGTIDTATDEVAKIAGIGDNYKDLKTRYGALKNIQKMTDPAAVAKFRNRTISPSDYGTALAMGIATGQPLAAAATAIVHKFLREKGSGVVAVGADMLASRMASRAQAARIGMAEAAASGIKPAKLSDKVISGTTKAAGVFRDTVDRVQSDSKSEKAISKTVDPLSKIAPKTASRVAMTLAQDRVYLRGLIPPGSPDMIVTKRSRPAVPTSAMASFNRAAQALDDPKSVTEDLSNGELSVEAAQAFRERRPELFETVRAAVFDKVAELASRGEVPTHQTRLQLSTLLGQPVDPMLEPARLKSLQNVHKQRYEAAAAAPPPPSGGGESARRIAERRMTDAEKVATTAS